MPTIKDVAEKAGVSVATVSYVINGTRKVAPETAARVRQAMEELGYQLNGIARSLRTRITYAIGVLVSDITNPFFATLVRGIEDKASEEGYHVIVCNSDEDPKKEDSYIRILYQRRVDGLIIAPTRDGQSSALHELTKQKVPVVLVDRKAKGLLADAVLSDNFGGAFKATSHLIDRGHCRIGIVLGIPGATTTEERFAGYCKALEDAGIPFSEKLVAWGGYRTEGGQRAVAQLLSLDNPPTAIFSTNNQMTVGALCELFARGIKIPNDVAVVGFDDLEWAEIFMPSLTVVAQKPYEIGHCACELLFARIKGVVEKFREIRIPVELRVRGST